MSCGASTNTIYVFWRLWLMGFKLLEKHNIISPNAPTCIYKRCRTRERWRGAPVPCVCWYMYLQTSSQANIDPLARVHYTDMKPLANSYIQKLVQTKWDVAVHGRGLVCVWYDFHWHHLLRNRRIYIKSSVVAMQKTVPLCCDLYQMHHVCTCGLSTGDTVCWF